MSYTIDVYRKQVTPVRNILDFALYVTYFPQLVAGPIERATHLLPQILKPRQITFKGFYEGYCLILWGLFLKMFVADNLSGIVDPVFANPLAHDKITILTALYAFSFQIYCDFAGYSEIARGLGKCMGFDISLNFNLPFFSTNPREFWRRWHISLSNWLKDYVYIPLGGNRLSRLLTSRNIAVTMILAGLWHGAAWHFVCFGAYWALLSLLHKIYARVVTSFPFFSQGIPRLLWKIMKTLFFFQLITLGFLFFRAQSLSSAIMLLHSLIVPNAEVFSLGTLNRVTIFCSCVFLPLMVSIFQYRKKDIDCICRLPFPTMVLLHAFLYYFIVFYSGQGRKFIYFEF
jgi:D-alanyl-lipoteichoic acid acyltransferase DltB (MBOAT superfamily)